MSRYNEHGLTARQEKFALAYVRTMCGAEAYRESYDTKTKRENTIHCEASKLLAHSKVAQRVAGLQSEAAERNEITVDKIVQELAKIAFANMLDYIRITEDGGAAVDLSTLDHEQAAAISEVTSEIYMDGRGDDSERVKRTKFKLADKRAALVDLGKHLGMFVERRENSNNNVHYIISDEPMTPDEWKAEYCQGAPGGSKPDLH